MDIQAGSGHRADHPGFAQLSALPAAPGTGLGTGTPPGHCSIQAGAPRAPLQGLWQKLRPPWPQCWLCFAGSQGIWRSLRGLGDFVVAAPCHSPPAGLPSLHQHWWQQGHLTDSGHGCHTRSSSSSHRACRVTRTSHPKPRALSTCATLWRYSGDSPCQGSRCPARSRP